MTTGRSHIAHLTSVHPVFDTRVFEKECRSLAGLGYSVTYVVPHTRNETVDGVRIHAVPKPASRRERMLRTTRQVLAAAIELDADLYHFHDPELIPVGLLLKARGKRVVYDVHENLPGDLLHSKAYVPGWMRSMLASGASGIEALAGMSFDGIVTITEGFARRFPSDKTCVISNFPIVNGVRTAGLAPHAERERLVVFTGGLAAERCAREMVEGVGLAAAQCPIRLAVAGAADSPELVASLQSGGTLDYLGRIDRAEVETLLSYARVGLVMIGLRPDFEDISTNKLYEYMLFGLPVIASPIASWKSEVEKIQCGLVLPDNSSASVAGAVTWLLDHPAEGEAMGRRGAEAVHSRFNWATQVGKLAAFYENLLNDRPAPARVAWS